MTLTLTDPIQINDTIERIELNSITFDFDTDTIHIGYDEMKADKTLVNKDKLLTVSGADFIKFRSDMNGQSGMNAWQAMRQTAFEFIRDLANRPGDISVGAGDTSKGR